MENKKLNQEDKKAAQEVTEISLEDLEQVAGGYSLREKRRLRQLRSAMTRLAEFKSQ